MSILYKQPTLLQFVEEEHWFFHWSAFFLIVKLRSSSVNNIFSQAEESVQEYVLTGVSLTIWVIFGCCDDKSLLDRFHEVHVSPPSLLEAEVAGGLRSDEILQCLLQQWKGWFKIHAVGFPSRLGLIQKGMDISSYRQESHPDIQERAEGVAGPNRTQMLLLYRPLYSMPRSVA